MLSLQGTRRNPVSLGSALDLCMTHAGDGRQALIIALALVSTAHSSKRFTHTPNTAVREALIVFLLCTWTTESWG